MKPQDSSSQQAQNQPQVVYMARPIDPHQQQVGPETQKRHEESIKIFPRLNLSKGEYVIVAIKRHPIGLIGVWAAVASIIVVVVALLMLVVAPPESLSSTLNTTGNSMPVHYLAIPAFLIILLAVIFGFVATIVYNANKFYLTNESVIQHIQTSLFSMREQTISLNNVEDASYTQDGIMPHLFNYGMLRLSTQGDETTYRFTYASSPSKQIAELNNAVESFKNVRPIDE